MVVTSLVAYEAGRAFAWHVSSVCPPGRYAASQWPRAYDVLTAIACQTGEHVAFHRGIYGLWREITASGATR